MNDTRGGFEKHSSLTYWDMEFGAGHGVELDSSQNIRLIGRLHYINSSCIVVRYSKISEIIFVHF